MISKIAIAGSFSGTHIGGSFQRAAEACGITVVAFDVMEAARGNRLFRSLTYRFLDRRLPGMTKYSRNAVTVCSRERPDLLITTGTAPMTATAVRQIREMGISTVNYSTDDPWNPAHRSRWHLDALKEYSAVFTTRRANIGDLEALGCRRVQYLPFAYDEWLISEDQLSTDAPVYDVLFVGGADWDRVRFMREYIVSGPEPALVGGYWQKYRGLSRYAKGQMSPSELFSVTKAARVNICLVRRANRDGHVMRSYEIAAVGCCMLVEDTAEHREMFGEDGECVRYFRTPRQLAALARELLADSDERARLSDAVRTRIREAGNSYVNRLATIIATVAPAISQ